ncbi:MAG: late competence development ComFB family protein [Clostridia bacterium]|nr:late competence development ComFB family protein [Clostridia bacterium]
MRVTNFMEICVKELFGEILKRYSDVCQCDRCLSDIAALALNNLPPKYTTTDLGMLYSRVNLLETQYRADIYRAITMAVECVRKNPRHE